VLQQGVRSITDLMVMPGLINLDFADVRSVMHEMGKAMMGTGEAEGDGRALEAAEKAIANPLLDGVSMQGAKGVIVSITGGEDMRLMEVDEAANHIRELVDPDANIIWGSAFNENLNGKIRVSVVATGIDNDGSVASPSAHATRPFAFSRPSEPVAEPAPAAASSLFGAAESEVAVDEEIAEVTAVEETDDSLELGAELAVDDESEAAEAAPSWNGEADAEAVEAANEDDLLELGDADVLAANDEQPSFPPADVTPPPERAAPRISTGGTLFERMSNLSRGLGRSDEDGDSKGDDKDGGSSGGLNIPRFLDRQSNN
jgi:cell division protein FtsZ